MSSDQLKAAKDRVQEQFLGKAGIHAVGTSVAGQAIRVYTHSADQLEAAGVLTEIRRVAAPFPVLTVTELPPKAQ